VGSTPHDQKWTYPSIEGATGLWARVLSKSKLKVAGVSWAGGSGDYKTSPQSPTGFWPDYLQVAHTLPPRRSTGKFHHRPSYAPRRTTPRCFVACESENGVWGWGLALFQEVLKVINAQYRTNIELERVYYDTSDLVLAAVADGEVDLSMLPGHSQPAPRDPYSRRRCCSLPSGSAQLPQI
jgi:hypothetical protein